ncbi:protein FAM53B isoform X2 [Falco cherrug]|uniref:protein FAM53B isoform X2 n=1 Tax=Falco cherrug TaxID=345164 RepID=UPI00247991A3|nr:protein FAM53B isoform X2 [Falco cherrug]
MGAPLEPYGSPTGALWQPHREPYGSSMGALREPYGSPAGAARAAPPGVTLGRRARSPRGGRAGQAGLRAAARRWRCPPPLTPSALPGLAVLTFFMISVLFSPLPAPVFIPGDAHSGRRPGSLPASPRTDPRGAPPPAPGAGAGGPQVRAGPCLRRPRSGSDKRISSSLPARPPRPQHGGGGGRGALLGAAPTAGPAGPRRRHHDLSHTRQKALDARGGSCSAQRQCHLFSSWISQFIQPTAVPPCALVTPRAAQELGDMPPAFELPGRKRQSHCQHHFLQAKMLRQSASALTLSFQSLSLLVCKGVLPLPLLFSLRARGQ